ncbi:hypothetical protein DFO83_111105 [Idiomarina loihiensis]|uniref:hypothetical protein n=1 Tax=Idiomarina TaxID=135575 RepID=UPI000D715D49|nr:hypothetical protein [Idiomarina]PWW34578.1 hypothetical protein DFO83_111105 [Idiomarina loihiensis]TDP43714.1 hypothetical protein DET58_11811 [Idiomarina loihiensis]TDS18455.1 hypothetical protein DET62_1181 [Idiomarina sp. H2]
MKKADYKSVKVVTDITCDVCGVSVVPEIQKTYHENLKDFDEFAVLHATYGYGSNHDGDSFHFDLCETCFGELVDRIKELRASNSFQ